MKKTYLVTTVILTLIAISFAFTTAYEPLYKNLKILPKDITKPQMDSVMRSFARSLGVKCDYCHARNEGKQGLDFASDKEEAKATARDMMRLQAKLNKKFFSVKDSKSLNAKLKVTCYSCHHGQAEPAKVAPAPPPGSQGNPPGAPPAGAPSGTPPGTPPAQPK